MNARMEIISTEAELIGKRPTCENPQHADPALWITDTEKPSSASTIYMCSVIPAQLHLLQQFHLSVQPCTLVCPTHEKTPNKCPRLGSELGRPSQ